jgi:hypothetical protein
MTSRPQAPLPNSSGRASTTRLRLQDAQLQDSVLSSRPPAPTSAPSGGSQGSSRVVPRRPRSGPPVATLSALDADAGQSPSHANHDGDDDDDHVTLASSRAPSTTVSATSTALRSAAIAALERALGRDLPLQVKSRVRTVPGVTGADGYTPDDVMEPDETGNVPLLHVVLTASDVKSIKDPGTLRFLQEHSRAFLKYVGEEADAPEAPPATDKSAADERDLMSSSTGPRAPSRQGVVSHAPVRQSTADDIGALAQRLCDEIATFITTVDSEGTPYIIATDKHSGELRVPVDLDDDMNEGAHNNADVGVLRDLAGFSSDDDVDGDGDGGNYGASASADGIPELVGDDSTERGAVASDFADHLVRVRKELEAKDRAAEREARAAQAHATSGASESPIEGTDDEVPDESAAVDSSKRNQARRHERGQVQFSATTGTDAADDLATGPHGAMRLFQPQLNAPPNRRIQAMLKYTSKDKRPRYMQPAQPPRRTEPSPPIGQQQTPPRPAKVRGAQHEQQQPPPSAADDDDDTPTSPVNRSSFGAAVVPGKKATLHERGGKENTSDTASDVPASSAAGDAAAAPVIKPQRPEISARHERRIAWLLDNEAWETAAPNAKVAAGEDNDPTVYDTDSAHWMPAGAAYVLPSRMTDIDVLLAQFETARADSELSRPLELEGATADDTAVYELGPSRPLTAAPRNGDIPDESDRQGAPPPPRRTAAVVAPAPATRPAPTTAAAEEAFAQEQRRKQLGSQYVAEQRDERIRRAAMARINERLSALTTEVSRLMDAHPRLVHKDPAVDLTSTTQTRPDSRVNANGGGDNGADLFEQASLLEVERLVEQARREQMRAAWTQRS